MTSSGGEGGAIGVVVVPLVTLVLVVVLCASRVSGGDDYGNSLTSSDIY